MSECVLPAQACRDLRVGPSKFAPRTTFQSKILNLSQSSPQELCVATVCATFHYSQIQTFLIIISISVADTDTVTDLLMGLFRGAVFHHGVPENSPLTLMGRFPSRKSSGRQPIKKRGIKRFLIQMRSISQWFLLGADVDTAFLWQPRQEGGRLADKLIVKIHCIS